MNHALICVDNLQVGGYQRLALDEAYALADRGFNVQILVLDEDRPPTSKVPTFIEIEKDLIFYKDVRIVFSSHKWHKLVLNLHQVFGLLPQNPLIIAHSLRCTFAIKLLKVFRHNGSFLVNTKIHQLPSLTDPRQRIKRLIYSQFADNLFGFSEAVKSSWKSQFGCVFRLFLRFSKEINLLRNGIYLDRLPLRSQLDVNSIPKPRLIFLGRITFWKGIRIFEEISKLDSLNYFDFLFIVPSYTSSDFYKLQTILGDRFKIIEGKSVSSLKLFDGDVHLYPTDYGLNSKFTESISLNCLEMAGIGIPSLVTKGGQLTWPEEVFKKVFFEVEWNDLAQVASKIVTVSKLRISDRELEEIRRKIDINLELDILVGIS